MAGGNLLGNLFGRSPIGPIQEHMQIAHEAAELLPDLFQASANDDWKKARQLYKQIEQVERSADKIKQSVRRQRSVVAGGASSTINHDLLSVAIVAQRAFPADKERVRTCC